MSSVESRGSLRPEYTSNYRRTHLMKFCELLHMNIIEVGRMSDTIPRFESSRIGSVGKIFRGGAQKVNIFYQKYKGLVLNREAEAQCCRAIDIPSRKIRVTCEPGFALIKRDQYSLIEQPENSVLVGMISCNLTTEIFLYMLLALESNKSTSSSACGPSLIIDKEDDEESNDSVSVKSEQSIIKDELIVKSEDESTSQDSVQDSMLRKRARDVPLSSIEEQPEPKRKCNNKEATRHPQQNDQAGVVAEQVWLSPLLREEFERSGQTNIVNIFKLIECKESYFTGLIEMKSKYPEIDLYWTNMQMIRLALCVCEEGVNYDPPRLYLLSALATNRIFLKFSHYEENLPKKRGTGRQLAFHKLSMYFQFFYPNGNLSHYLKTGQPYKV